MTKPTKSTTTEGAGIGAKFAAEVLKRPEPNREALAVQRAAYTTALDLCRRLRGWYASLETLATTPKGRTDAELKRAVLDEAEGLLRLGRDRPQAALGVSPVALLEHVHATTSTPAPGAEAITELLAELASL